MRNKLIVLSLVAVLLTSCAGGRSLGVESFAPVSMEAADNFASDIEYSEDGASFSEKTLNVQETQIRMVIKNASLSIVVEEPSVTMDLISSLAERLGGYVVSSNLYRVQTDSGLDIPQASISIRVPAEYLDQALGEIKSGAGQVLSENVSGQDVTQEYTDLESRLKNLERAEEQLAEILEASFETEDVLNVYNRLVEIREQIEVIKGEMKYAEDRKLAACWSCQESNSGIDQYPQSHSQCPDLDWIVYTPCRPGLVLPGSLDLERTEKTQSRQKRA
jgi:hypothetical protein